MNLDKYKSKGYTMQLKHGKYILKRKILGFYIKFDTVDSYALACAKIQHHRQSRK